VKGTTNKDGTYTCMRICVEKQSSDISPPPGLACIHEGSVEESPIVPEPGANRFHHGEGDGSDSICNTKYRVERH
jgi:hypothetical protein